MNRRVVVAISIALVCILLAAEVNLAAPQVFDLSWWTVDGGGGVSASEAYKLQGTIGQADAGYQMSNGEYTLDGGFWGSSALPQETNEIYLPIMLR